jgi:hypothetical protein
MKRHALILIVLLISLALPALSDNGIDCRVSQEYPPGQRLWTEDPIISVDGSQPCFVAQGFGALPPCFDGMDSASICSAAQANWQFELRINGVLMTPDYLTIYKYDPGSPMNLATDTWGDLDSYIMRWVYAFPAGHFATGIYFFEGTFTRNEVSCDVCPCEGEIVYDAKTTHRASTVTVTYPYDWPGSP